MMKIVRLVSIVFIAGVFLTACNEARTYQYFMLHPLEIKAALGKCQTMTPAKARQEKTCIAAARAEQDARQLLIQAEQNGQEFGLKVMHLQIKLAQNKQEIGRLRQIIASAEKDRNPNQQKQLIQLQEKLKQAEQNVALEQQTLKQRLAILSLLGP